jgi:hypothetical protein
VARGREGSGSADRARGFERLRSERGIGQGRPRHCMRSCAERSWGGRRRLSHTNAHPDLECQERCAWRRRLAAVAERGIAASSRSARLSPSVRPRPSPTLRTGDRSSGHDAHPICRAFCPPCPRPRSMYDHLRQSRAAWASEACASDASGRSQEGRTRLHWSPLEPDSWQSVAMRR